MKRRKVRNLNGTARPLPKAAPAEGERSQQQGEGPPWPEARAADPELLVDEIVQAVLERERRLWEAAQRRKRKRGRTLT